MTSTQQDRKTCQKQVCSGPVSVLLSPRPLCFPSASVPHGIQGHRCTGTAFASLSPSLSWFHSGQSRMADEVSGAYSCISVPVDRPLRHGIFLKEQHPGSRETCQTAVLRSPVSGTNSFPASNLLCGFRTVHIPLQGALTDGHHQNRLHARHAVPQDALA